MGTYITEWDCCGQETRTESWIPDECPFCKLDSMETATEWYIQCRELEGDMYNRNFFEPLDQESLTEISASTAKAWKEMLEAVGYKSTYERDNAHE